MEKPWGCLEKISQEVFLVLRGCSRQDSQSISRQPLRLFLRLSRRWAWYTLVILPLCPISQLRDCSKTQKWLLRTAPKDQRCHSGWALFCTLSRTGFTCDMWQVNCYIWHLTCALWHWTSELWHVTCALWHVTSTLLWHVTGKGALLSKLSVVWHLAGPCYYCTGASLLKQNTLKLPHWPCRMVKCPQHGEIAWQPPDYRLKQPKCARSPSSGVHCTLYNTLDTWE